MKLITASLGRPFTILLLSFVVLNFCFGDEHQQHSTKTTERPPPPLDHLKPPPHKKVMITAVILNFNSLFYSFFSFIWPEPVQPRSKLSHRQGARLLPQRWWKVPDCFWIDSLLSRTWRRVGWPATESSSRRPKHRSDVHRVGVTWAWRWWKLPLFWHAQLYGFCHGSPTTRSQRYPSSRTFYCQVRTGYYYQKLII